MILSHCTGRTCHQLVWYVDILHIWSYFEKKEKEKPCTVWYDNENEVVKMIMMGEVAEISHKEYSKALAYTLKH